MIHVTPTWRVILGDTIAGMSTLAPESVHCCVTSGLIEYPTTVDYAQEWNDRAIEPRRLRRSKVQP